MNICSHAHTQPYKVNLLRTATPLSIPIHITHTYTAAPQLKYNIQGADDKLGQTLWTHLKP
jgi:hypothetical protein